MAKKMLLISVLLLLSQGAHSMSWLELEQQIAASEAGEVVDQNLMIRFSEMVQMLVVMTKAQALKDRDSLLFCPPEGGSLHIDQIISMLRVQARGADNQAQVQNLLLQTFVAEYPC